MASLKWSFAVLLLGLVAACSTPPGPVTGLGEPASGEPTAVTEPTFAAPTAANEANQSAPPTARVPVPTEEPPLPRASAAGPGVLPSSSPGWRLPGFRPDELPFGWFTVPGWPERTGVSGHFWTTERDFWKDLVAGKLPLSQSIYPLQARLRQSGDELERFWATFFLERSYVEAGVAEAARPWRSTAMSLRPSDFLALEGLWDLAMIQKDKASARLAWRSQTPLILPLQADQTKAALLRQALFLGQIDLKPRGLDPFVSSLALDNDDLWIGTWNGGLARLSLVTGEWLVLEKPKAQIAPIRLVKASRYFIYVFQEQSFSRYSKVTQGWKEFAYPADWSGLRVQDVWVESDEKLWLAHLGRGLWSWTAGNWENADGAGAPLFVNALVADGEGGLWVGTRDQGLLRFGGEGWSRQAGGPTNISVLAAPGDGRRGLWAVGSWGEGLWLFDGRGWSLLSAGKEFVTAIDWNGSEPWWGTLDEGLWKGRTPPLAHLGLAEGVPEAGIAALVNRAGRLYWGTTGQSLGVWSEDDDPMVYR